MSSSTLNDGEMSSSPSDTEAEADAHEELLAFISKLDPEKKRKAEDDDVQVPPSRKRRMIKEQTEGGVENEFSAQSAGMSSFSLTATFKPLFS
jgi:U3 small nucleolar RNA-associated protein 14